MIKIATVCMNVAYDKEVNLKKYFSYIDEAATNGVKLIVFPEQSLQGYLSSLNTLKLTTFDYQHENAELVPEGESTQKLIKKAKENGMYIVYGMTERDEERADVLYNIMVLVGPEGFVGKYRKVHQPKCESLVYFPGNSFNVFNTEIGKIGMMICYDKTFPESSRELALQGAEIICMSTAWPIIDQNVSPEKDSQKILYDLYDMARAAENQCFFISSNQVGISGDTNYAGHSRIVSPSAVVLGEVSGFVEGIAIAEVDVKADIIRGRTHGMGGLNTLKDRKPNAYIHIAVKDNYL